MIPQRGYISSLLHSSASTPCPFQSSIMVNGLSLISLAAFAVVPAVAQGPASCAVRIIRIPGHIMMLTVKSFPAQIRCTQNMNDKAQALGCAPGDHGCLCTKQDYQFGIRDCTNQACPGADAAQAVSDALGNCPMTFGPFFASSLQANQSTNREYDDRKWNWHGHRNSGKHRVGHSPYISYDERT